MGFKHLLSAAFYDELRTQQQLGYVVSLSMSITDHAVRISFVVQTEYPPDFVRGCIDAFVAKKITWILDTEGLSQDEFATHCKGLASEYAEKPKNLNEAFDRHWNEVN